jgi:hypothetical protein
MDKDNFGKNKKKSYGKTLQQLIKEKNYKAKFLIS